MLSILFNWVFSQKAFEPAEGHFWTHSQATRQVARIWETEYAVRSCQIRKGVSRVSIVT
jgi:hypothetical protein